LRATGAETADGLNLVQRLGEMGEPLYDKLEPTGFRDNAETWLSTAAVMARISFANAVVNGQVPGVRIDKARFAGKDSAAIAHDVLNRDASPQTLAAIEKGLGTNPASPGPAIGLVIASPEFQRR
jgi:uncharacterized protein (DUF1800 family)